MKYSLPPSKRLVMTLTAEDNGACLHYSTVLKILETRRRAQEKTNYYQKYHLEIKVVKIMQKIITFFVNFYICEVPKSACRRFARTEFLSEKVSFSKCLGQMCRARERVFSLLKFTLRSQRHQGWWFKFFFSEFFYDSRVGQGYFQKQHLSSISGSYCDWANNWKKKGGGVWTL